MWPFNRKYTQLKKHAEYMEFCFNLAQDDVRKQHNDKAALESKILALQVRNQKLVEKLESVSAKLADTRKRNKTLVAAINRRGKKSGQ